MSGGAGDPGALTPTATPLMTQEQAVEARVRAALALIETAQNEIDRACQAMSAIIGALPDYERLRKLAAKTKAEWYRLRNRREEPAGAKWKLDHGPANQYDAEFARRAAEGVR